VVNKDIITREELKKRWEGSPPGAMENRTIQAILKELIDEHLLLSQAKQLKITLPESTLDMMMEKMNPQEFQEDSQELKEEMRRQWLLGEISSKLCPLPRVPEQEIKDYYQHHRKEFTLPAQVTARQIVVTTRKAAREIIRKLKIKGNFTKLAKQYSWGPEKKKGGLLHPIYKGEEPPGFQILFKLRKGQISPIIKSPYGFHIFKIVDKKKSATIPYKKAHDSIAAIIQLNKQKECLKKWLMAARQKSHIEVYRDKLFLPEGKHE